MESEVIGPANASFTAAPHPYTTIISTPRLILDSKRLSNSLFKKETPKYHAVTCLLGMTATVKKKYKGEKEGVGMFQNGKEFPPIKEVKVGERKRESLRASSLDPPLT